MCDERPRNEAASCVMAAEVQLRLASGRPDGPFGHPTQLSRDLDRLVAKYHRRGLEQDFVLCRPDLGLDDLDDEILLVAAREPGGAIPNADSTLVGGPSRNGARDP